MNEELAECHQELAASEQRCHELLAATEGYVYESRKLRAEAQKYREALEQAGDAMKNDRDEIDRLREQLAASERRAKIAVDAFKEFVWERKRQ
jgi:hypothetical protein